MNSNQPFHPTTAWFDEQAIGTDSGITKREYMALQIFTATLPRVETYLAQTHEDFELLSRMVIRDSIALAEMLIEELNR